MVEGREGVFLLERLLFVLDEWDTCHGRIVYAEGSGQADVREHDVVGNESPWQVLHQVIK